MDDRNVKIGVGMMLRQVAEFGEAQAERRANDLDMRLQVALLENQELRSHIAELEAQLSRYPKRIDQTAFGVGKGNCFQACVASTLGLELREVPNFCVEYDDTEWFPAFQRWLHERGFGCVYWPATNDTERESLVRFSSFLSVVPSIGSGPNKSGDMHCTVWIGGELHHDPNPSRGGIERLDDMLFIVPSPKAQLSRGVFVRDMSDEELRDVFRAGRDAATRPMQHSSIENMAGARACIAAATKLPEGAVRWTLGRVFIDETGVSPSVDANIEACEDIDEGVYSLHIVFIPEVKP